MEDQCQCAFLRITVMIIWDFNNFSVEEIRVVGCIMHATQAGGGIRTMLAGASEVWWRHGSLDRKRSVQSVGVLSPDENERSHESTPMGDHSCAGLRYHRSLLFAPIEPLAELSFKDECICSLIFACYGFER
ncbi:uncharacterized protein A4U43_C08F26710 [Asparagus officinalis]|nr:uncharacterized protein A4U43_C08F26710 [Asparagus officinalis]